MRSRLATLLATSGAVPVNRLSGVELVTTGGRVVPILLAISRRRAPRHGLADFVRFRSMPSSGAFLVSEADAAVVVWADRDPDVRRVLALVERKGIPVHVIGAPESRHVRPQQ